jgi:hypothetical protein
MFAAPREECCDAEKPPGTPAVGKKIPYRREVPAIKQLQTIDGRHKFWQIRLQGYLLRGKTGNTSKTSCL